MEQLGWLGWRRQLRWLIRLRVLLALLIRLLLLICRNGWLCIHLWRLLLLLVLLVLLRRLLVRRLLILRWWLLVLRRLLLRLLNVLWLLLNVLWLLLNVLWLLLLLLLLLLHWLLWLKLRRLPLLWSLLLRRRTRPPERQRLHVCLPPQRVAAGAQHALRLGAWRGLGQDKPKRNFVYFHSVCLQTARAGTVRLGRCCRREGQHRTAMESE